MHSWRGFGVVCTLQGPSHQGPQTYRQMTPLNTKVHEHTSKPMRHVSPKQCYKNTSVSVQQQTNPDTKSTYHNFAPSRALSAFTDAAAGPHCSPALNIASSRTSTFPSDNTFSTCCDTRCTESFFLVRLPGTTKVSYAATTSSSVSLSTVSASISSGHNNHCKPWHNEKA